MVGDERHGEFVGEWRGSVCATGDGQLRKRAPHRGRRSRFAFPSHLVPVLLVMFAWPRSNGSVRPWVQANASPFVPSGYQLTWSDEFNGPQLDRSKWAPRAVGPRGGGWISGERAFLDHQGHLIIETVRHGSRLETGMIGTQESFRTCQGYFEARVKFPLNGGHTAAFWLQSVGNTKGGGSPASMGVEIDIVEFYRGRVGGMADNALHWNGYTENEQTRIHRFPFAADENGGWHTFGMLWTEEGYRFYADGAETWNVEGDVSLVPEYVILGSTISTGGLPTSVSADSFVVDYVRVYEPARSVDRGPGCQR